MKFNDYYYKKHFEDRAGTHFTNQLVYTGSIFSDGYYITASLPLSSSTAATQRLGTTIVRNINSTPKTYEEAGT